MSVALEKKKRFNPLGFLRPAPYQKEMQDKDEIKTSYRYWRLRIFYSMYVGYALFYFSRKSFTFAMPGLSESLGFDKAQLGLLGSILSITYGVSKFISGIVGDRSNPRYFMAIGLILTGIFNLLFGMSSTLLYFAIFWGLNGWFQGWGWPGCAKLLTHWYSRSERGRWWSLWNTCHNLGGAVIPILATAVVASFGWRYALYIPGALCIITGLFLLNRLRDTPQSLGLPSIEKYRNDYSSSSVGEEKESLSTKEILVEYVLKNKFIWVLAISSFFIYFIRTGVYDWALMYLIETKGYSAVVAGGCVSWFEIGGFLGSLAAGWSSDKLFQARRNPINVLFTLGVLAALFATWKIVSTSPYIDGALIFMVGFFVFGPQMLIGVAAAELSHKKAAATSTGFAGCFAYLGAAAAGYPLGLILQTWGWEGFFIILACCAVIASLLFLPMWSVKTNPREAEKAN